MSLNRFNQTVTVAGTIVSVSADPGNPSFSIAARSGDTFEAVVGRETYYQVLSNLDGLDRDRVPDPRGVARDDGRVFSLHKYAVPGRLVFVTGIYQENDGSQRFEARTVYLLHSDKERYLFEETHWWPTQTTQMADRILDHLFDAKRNYSIDDFSELYRTNLNILGQATDETVQESAVLSRLLYDLSSAYLMTGAERYLMAARAAANYLREAFRSLSHDGRYCFWAYGRKRNMQGERGESLLFASQGPDDVGTIPLYEQIYAIAGLTQFYRITLDWEVLEDIRRTINSFQDFFWDLPQATQKGFAGKGGYYSHLDPATMRPDAMRDGSPAAENRSRKNWNSVGDHIPAYLVNLILSLEPLPQGKVRSALAPLLEVCHGIIEETSSLICEKFPDPESDFVCERFLADWTPDLSYRWQRNRAVVGHNLKIAWNLTRCAYYFQTRAKRLRDAGETRGSGWVRQALRALPGGGEASRRPHGRGGPRQDPRRHLRLRRAEAERRHAHTVRLGRHQGLLAAGAGYSRLPDPLRRDRKPALPAAGPGVLGVLEPVLPGPRASGLFLPHHGERPAGPGRPVRHEEQPCHRLSRLRAGLSRAPLYPRLRRGGRRQ